MDTRADITQQKRLRRILNCQICCLGIDKPGLGLGSGHDVLRLERSHQRQSNRRRQQRPRM